MNELGLLGYFDRKESVSDGASVYDFLGGAINASYKHSWGKNVLPKGEKIRPGYPGLSEWTIDWTASLIAAVTADQQFRVVELGAGYGQWMVTAILAYRSIKQGPVHGMAVEADSAHYEWLIEHTRRNLGHLKDVELDLIHGAAGLDGDVSFPVIPDPSKDYGASYARSGQYQQTITVPCRSLANLYDRFGHGPVDLLHIDIQGAEADLIKDPRFIVTLQNTRIILFGTHTSHELHGAVRECLAKADFEIKVDWPRDSKFTIADGELTTHDGALLALNRNSSQIATSLFDFETLKPGDVA